MQGRGKVVERKNLTVKSGMKGLVQSEREGNKIIISARADEAHSRDDSLIFYPDVKLMSSM